METREILNTRQRTHGDFTVNSQVSQEIKNILRRAIERDDNHSIWHSYQFEALDMICHKIARIVAGNPNEVDHWADIAGYAQLVVDRITPIGSSTTSPNHLSTTSPDLDGGHHLTSGSPIQLTKSPTMSRI